MTYKEFCEEIGDGVLSVVPSAKYVEPKAHLGPASVGFGPMKAALSRTTDGWLVEFTRKDGITTRPPMRGSTMTPSTAAQIAQAIAGFLT